MTAIEINHEVPLTFSQFWSEAADAIGLDVEEVVAEKLLFDDLGLDSLHVALLVAFLDERDCEVPEDLLPALHTAGDVYAHYAVRTGGEREGADR
jgi:acyl carrier protein